MAEIELKKNDYFTASTPQSSRLKEVFSRFRISEATPLKFAGKSLFGGVYKIMYHSIYIGIEASEFKALKITPLKK